MMKNCYNENKSMIELKKEELVFDIKNTAYTFADSISSGVEDKHLIHNIFDVGEGGNRDKLARILDSTIEDCKEMLFRFTKAEMHGGGYDSDEWEDCEGSPGSDDDFYSIPMRMPHGFSQTSIHTMTVYIHDYIVNQALYEWCMLVYPDGAERFLALAEEKKRKIKEASNRSAGRERIRLHPF